MINTDLPEKSFFKVDEVCSITGIKSYVLRFWEAEFAEINPIISSSGKKIYESRDVYVLSVIKKLLFEDKLTIEKAKSQLRSMDLDSIDLNSISSDNKLGDEKIAKSEINYVNAAKRELEKLVAITDSVKDVHHWR